MISLRLLGGLELTSDGAAVSGRGAQRHRLALLALLGASRIDPVSRAKLTDILWPEADRRGSHLLSNSVYLLRELLGEDAVQGTPDALWLNSGSVRCDHRDFFAAIRKGDLVDAAALYAGPFLDGFYLASTPAFEAWVDAERDRCARAYAGVLETLARECEAAADFRGAAAWWAGLQEIDPLGVHTTLSLMRALEACGEIEGALRCARSYEARVRGELGVEPDRSISLFAARLARERSDDDDSRPSDPERRAASP